MDSDIAKVAVAILVILASGFIGGYAGYLESLFPGTNPPGNGKDAAGDPGNTPPAPQPNVRADIIIGIVAAACVPAFIKLTSNSLTKDVMGNLTTGASWLYLAGLCLVAAYASRTFLSNFSNKVLKMEVANMQQTINRLNSKIDRVDAKLNRAP